MNGRNRDICDETDTQPPEKKFTNKTERQGPIYLWAVPGDLTLSLEAYMRELQLGTLADVDFWRRLLLECGSFLSCYSDPYRPEWALNSQSRNGGTIRKLVVISIAFVCRTGIVKWVRFNQEFL